MTNRFTLTWPSRRPRSMRVGPIGLDIGQESMNLVQLENGPDGKIGLKAGVGLGHGEDRATLLSSPARFKAGLREVLRQGDFSGRQVVSVLPPSLVRIIATRYEVGANRTDAAAIVHVLRDRLEGDLSDYVIDYIPVRGDNQSTERLALTSVARRDVVIEYLELLRKAGLEVLALEIGPVAILRLFAAQIQPDQIRNQLVINFGATSSYLTMISGRRLLQDQEVNFGEQDLLAQIGTSLQSTPDEARAMVARFGLARREVVSGEEAEAANALIEIVRPRMMRLVDEISRVLIYTASETRGGSVDGIYLMGSMARWPGIGSLLQSLVNIPVAVLDNPLGLFKRSSDLDGQALAIASGLALRGMETHG